MKQSFHLLRYFIHPCLTHFLIIDLNFKCSFTPHSFLIKHSFCHQFHSSGKCKRLDEFGCTELYSLRCGKKLGFSHPSPGFAFYSNWTSLLVVVVSGSVGGD